MLSVQQVKAVFVSPDRHTWSGVSAAGCPAVVARTGSRWWCTVLRCCTATETSLITRLARLITGRRGTVRWGAECLVSLVHVSRSCLACKWRETVRWGAECLVSLVHVSRSCLACKWRETVRWGAECLVSLVHVSRSCLACIWRETVRYQR